VGTAVEPETEGNERLSDWRMAVKSAPCVLTTLAMLALCGLETVHAQARAKADVSCQPAEKLHYDCIIKLANSRTGEPLSGLTLMVGADMPSMPGAHNVRPVKATEEQDKGTYRARIVLEMYGDWALRMDLSGAVRDRAVKLLRFESDRVGEATPAPRRHRH
jgi:YtkA-like